MNTDCVTGTFVVDKESKMKPTTKALREATLNKSDELQDKLATGFRGTIERFRNTTKIYLYFFRNINKI